MGLMRRFLLIVKSKINALLGQAENPNEQLEYSYEKQLELLQQVRRGVVDVTTSKKRLEAQVTKLQASLTDLDAKARAAMQAGREDLARIALERKQGVQTQLTGLTAQQQQLEAEQQKLVGAEQKLAAKVEAFRTQKETIKAQYTAAEAQVKINEAFSGVSEEMADVGLALQRAEDKTEQMKARAGALDELLESGALDDLTQTGDVLDRELAKVTQQGSVDAELDALKKELGQATATPGLEQTSTGEVAPTPPTPPAEYGGGPS
ncbi:MAG TPA: PspA/IM30 family protein [Miltoncostaeales bacterium]|jgi:phage shock protein A|nr:PspA/IM30 family protein [Miltoncostaeales bacterium]